MHAIEPQDWQSLPEHAQQEIYDFFLFIKQRHEKQAQKKHDLNQTLAFSNHGASNIDEWASDKEDEIWT